MSENKGTYVVEGIAYYPFLNHQYPDKGFDGDTPNLQVSLVPNKESKKVLKDQKIDFLPPRGDIPEDYVRFKTKWVDNPLRVVDAHNKTIPVDEILVGNGSRVKVHYKLNSWSRGNKEYVSPVLLGVQVLELVEYIRSGPFEEEDGFTVGEASNTSEGDTADTGL